MDFDLGTSCLYTENEGKNQLCAAHFPFYLMFVCLIAACIYNVYINVMIISFLARLTLVQMK